MTVGFSRRLFSLYSGLGYFLSIILANAMLYGYAYVQLDDETFSQTTTPFRKRLMAGPHRVRIIRAGYTAVPDDTVVVVPLNREVRIFCRLRPE